jgi:hypothetical protein
VIVDPNAVGAIRLFGGHDDLIEALELVVRYQLSSHEQIVASQVGYSRLEVQESAQLYEGSGETVSL